MIRRLIAAGMVAGLLTGCGGSSESDEAAEEATFDVAGLLYIYSSARMIDDNNCAGYDGYNDVVGGAQVVIRDAEDTKVAIGKLGDGVPSQESDGACVFRFFVKDVPDSGEIYSVEVTHRGGVSFKKSEAQDIEISLD